MAISVKTSYKPTVSASKSASTSKATSSSKSASTSKATSSSKAASTSKATSSSKSASTSKVTSSNKSASNSKATSNSKSASTSKATSSSKSASTSKVTSNSKSASTSKVTSSSKSAGTSKTTSSNKSASNSKATSSNSSITSSYKPANTGKNVSNYKPPAGYYSYKNTSVSQLVKSSNTKYGMDKIEESKKKSSVNSSKNALSQIQASVKDKLKESTKICSATIESVKKKVQKSLSDSVLELRKSQDYLGRLNKAYKAGLDSSAKQICDEVSDTIDLAKKVVKKKGGIGAGPINLLLDGCEKLTNTVIKGAAKIGEYTLSTVLDLSKKTIGVVGDVIDFANPGKKQVSVNQIIEQVEKGKLKLTDNIQKGNYGEMKMDQYYEKKGYVRISKDRVMSLDEPVHQGIDGVYYNVDKQKGEPTYIIAEAKYNQSKLGYTKYDGKQMSDRWIFHSGRLDDDVTEDIAIQIRKANAKADCEKQVVHVFPDGTVKVKKIK